ncbi:MAG: hypothetical protein GY731_19435, partial [Gammaproteobacteria bacterium]|nr:hypothetical protein [Gammaproteobacteria bacterium]
MTGSGRLQLAGNGNLQLINDARIDLASGGVFDVQADGAINAGAVPGASRIALAAGATLRKSGAAGTTMVDVATFNDGLVDAQSGTLSFTADGTHTGDFNSDAVLEFAGGTQNMNGSLFTGTGVTRLAGAALNLQSASSVFNTLEWDSGTIGGIGPLNIGNTGILRTTSAGVKTFATVLDNNGGLVAVDAGTLQLTQGSNHTGSFTVGLGANLEFLSGTHTVGGTVTGAGQVTVSGATATMNNAFDVTGQTAVSAGTATFNGLTRMGSLAVTGGVLNTAALDVSGLTAFGGTGTTTLGGPANFGSMDLAAGSLGGSGNIAVAGLSTLSGGSLGAGGTFNANGGANISGPVTLDRSTVFSGSSTWSAGDISGVGLITNTGGLDINGGGQSMNNAFVNSGTVNKSAGSATTFNGSFLNSGLVRHSGGDLISGAGGYVQTGGETRLEDHTLTAASDILLNGGSLTGRGIVDANLTVNGATVAPGFSPGKITVNGDFVMDQFSILAIEIGGTNQGVDYD